MRTGFAVAELRAIMMSFKRHMAHINRYKGELSGSFTAWQ